MNSQEIADAIRDCFISVNVPDSNWEPSNLVDVVNALAIKLDKTESLPSVIGEVAVSLGEVAGSMIRIAKAIESLNKPGDIK